MKKMKAEASYSEAEKTIMWFYLQNLHLNLTHCKIILSELIGGDLGQDILKSRMRLTDVAKAANRSKALVPSKDTRKTLIQALRFDRSSCTSDIETIPVL